MVAIMKIATGPVVSLRSIVRPAGHPLVRLSDSDVIRAEVAAGDPGNANWRCARGLSPAGAGEARLGR